ncbi:MAG: hypothetical protein ACRDBO_02635 [Lachnospiraceae bacterium]
MQTIIHNIVPFDSSTGTTLSFIWNGNQIYRVRCLIRENESGKLVYDQTIDTMKPSFPIPANSGLVNGTYYVCYITVFDINGTESAIQDSGKSFYCFSMPSFELSIVENQIIRASSFETLLTYSQKEGEALNSYSITLYSYQKTALQSSGTVYDKDHDTAFPSPYLISALENANQYYIHAVGQTVHGMTIETDYILFTVAYTQAQVFSTLEVNNLADIGAIEIRSNIISTNGTPDHDVIYIDGEKADLRDNTVTFDTGFEVEGDFSKVIRLSHPNLNQPFLTLSDSTRHTTIVCSYREGEFHNSNGKKAVIELKASSWSGIDYVLYSNYFDIPGESDSICYCISRIGNFFDTKVVSV